jgi:RhoGAP domain/MyTH4 domain/WW domain
LCWRKYENQSVCHLTETNLVVVYSLCVSTYSLCSPSPPQMSSSSSPPPSSSVWQAHVDPETGKTFYANSITGESTWERPQELDTVTVTASSPSPPPSSTTTTTTATTTRAPPPIPSSSSSSTTTPSSSWYQYFDDTTQNYFYYNTDTRETQWTAPEQFVPHAGAVAVADSDAVSSATPQCNYTRYLDANTNQYYYVHRISGAVQWEKPDEYVEHTRSTSVPHVPSEQVLAAHAEKSRMVRQSSQSVSETKAHTLPRGFSSTLAVPSEEPASDTTSSDRKHFSHRTVQSMPAGMRHDFRVLPAPLRLDISKFQMEGFATQHFRTVKKRRGFTKKVVPMSELIQWGSKTISKSLLEQSKDHNSSAVNCFKQIMYFMGDAESRKKQSSLAQSVIDLGIRKGALRDEIFCQLCKQTNNNPEQKSSIQGWKLMAMAAGTFAPSRNFQSFLLSYIASNFSKPNPVGRLAAYSYWRIEKTMKSGAQSPMPTVRYIDGIVKDGLPYHKPWFGGTLEYMISLQHEQGIEENVPMVLIKLVDLIRGAGGLTTKGIFRVAANKDYTIQVREQFESGDIDDIKCDDPHVAGDLLKIWLRELSETVLPENMYDDCLAVSDKGQEAVKLCMENLPPAHLSTLDYLIRFLKEVTANVATHNMNAENLAIVFCQNLLRNRNKDLADAHAIYKSSEQEKRFVRHLIEHWPDAE